MDSEKKSSIKCTTVLWHISFIGFAVNYMLRVNTSIPLVDMVQVKLTGTTNITITECFNISGDTSDTGLNISHTVLDEFNITTAKSLIHKRLRGWSIERYILDKMGVEYDINGFEWDEHKQGTIIGSYFWLHWAAQVPGGIWGRRYGTKLVFGLGNLIPCILCFFIPISAYMGTTYLIIIRIIQGFIGGLCWPAMHNLTAQWIPPNERSKFISAYLGSSVGVALCHPLFGLITSFSAWEWTFHFNGIFGVLWYLLWYFNVFDSPAEHPRIAASEREHIQKSLGKSIQRNVKHAIPWKAILKTRAVWMINLAQWGGIWGLFTTMTQAPAYFKYVHGWGIEMTGVLSGIPHITRVLFSIVYSMFSDYMLSSEKINATNVRKLAGFVSLILNGTFMVCLAFSGCHSLVAALFLTIANSLQGAVSTGALANMVDLSPNYASLLLGISGMIGCIPGFLSPILVGYLTFENQTTQQWKYVFLICAVNLIIAGVCFCLFTDAKLKSWNDPDYKKRESELVVLRADDKHEAYNPELEPLKEEDVETLEIPKNGFK